MDSSSPETDISSPELGPQPDDDELPIISNEIVEDLTGIEDMSDDGSAYRISLSLNEETVAIKPRPYQMEMVEESLRRNIIVAMDTGSGKTHIAVMRMHHELERAPSHQIIWFLAPTVSLCFQQFEYIQSQLKSVQVKFLSGADGVDRWSDQRLWDAVLKNVRVVVSTYQILLDALTHGFVKMDKLALIVFDEAHNCIGRAAGAKIMLNFYHKRKAQDLPIPHILGLTASPVMRSDPSSLFGIEETLDAICRIPTKHRAELRMQVKLPVLLQVYHENLPPEISLMSYTRTIQSLGQAYRNLNIFEDPYVISLRKEDSEKNRRKLEKILMSHKTWCHDQMKSFYATTLRICRELGGWAADYYVSQVVANVMKVSKETENFLESWDVTSAEKQYLAKILKNVEISRSDSQLPAQIPLVTDKVTKMIEVLQQDCTMFSGIIFVQERAMVCVLAHLLSVHPLTREMFRIGTMVGTSNHTSRARNFGDLVDMDAQKDALSMFKTGKINLVVATSVLEEGIDVPACNLVLCFTKPANLKSFVQRRGRARHRDSRLVLLFEEQDQEPTEWVQLEADMRELYEDEMRTLQELLLCEDEEEPDDRAFEVKHTQALLDLDNSVSHLYHFCATLPQKAYVDLRPEFICTSFDGGLIRCKVILPTSVTEAVRVAESQKLWKSERNAIKDAAFEAYVALYRTGLVNDNLLPLMRHDEILEELKVSVVETRASIVSVNEQINPWIKIAKAWNDVEAEIMQSTITAGDLEFNVYLPVDAPEVSPFRVFWDSQTEITITHKTRTQATHKDGRVRAPEDTRAILQAAFGSRFLVTTKPLVIQFSANTTHSPAQHVGSEALTSGYQLHQQSGLIRDKTDPNITYILNGILSSKPPITQVKNPYVDYDSSPDCPHLSLTRLSRRMDFLHPIQAFPVTSRKEYSIVLPTSRCTIDKMPWKFVQFGLLLPSIIHQFELYLIADELSKTILKSVNISNLSLIVTAICASSARENANYQRLEFLGDSILKMCTSVQLIGEYFLWHEGYLSAKKDRIVSNSRLSRAAMEIGLDRYIITKQFTGLKWRPPYIDDVLQLPTDGKRDMSTKVLADVVEALIGAAMLDGGIEKALACLQVFVPELHWQPLEDRQMSLFSRAPIIELPSTLGTLETLIGYRFQRKSLLVEAMTHASCNTASASLERFEFLGDSILDNIIVAEMYPHPLSHVKMHLLRTALVNADFLAFICMEWSINQEVIDLALDADSAYGYPKITENTKTIAMPLWRFLRHTSHSLAAAEMSTAKVHAELRESINNAIQTGTHYPWALLSRLQAQKFFSDVVESLLGAIWIDSGSFDECRSVVRRMGILPYFERILKDGVHVLHPKEELGILADSKEVKYVIECTKKTSGDGLEYGCTVFVGGEMIVSIGDGVGKEEVKTRAAEQAVKVLSGGTKCHR